MPKTRTAYSTRGWRYEKQIDLWIDAGLVQRTEWRGRPLIATPLPNAKKIPGAYFDPWSVERVLKFFLILKHLIGRWAGKDFRLLDWQVEFLVAPVFGWKHPDGTRIIRTVWFEIPRKNGKSTLSSGLGLYLLAADREPGAQVYAAAGKKDQAGLVFAPAKAMAKAAPQLKKRLKILGNLIEHRTTGSIFRALASDGELEMGLNVHGAVIDEVHVHKKRDLIDALETGTGSREQPLIVFITTADAGDRASIYDEKRKEIEQISKGTIVDPSTYGVVFACDEKAEGFDPFSVEAQRAANPGYGVTVMADYLAGKAAKAAGSPAKLNVYKRLHLNIRTRSHTAWFDPQQYASGGSIVVEEKLKGRDCYGGLDLAATSDFNAWVLLFPFKPDEPDGWVDVLARFWIPRQAIERRDDMRDTFERWEKDGWIKVTDGDVQDQTAIRRQMEADATTFNLVEAAYDPWNSGFVPELSDGGMAIHPIPQQINQLNAPSKAIERWVLLKKFHHGGNPVLAWMFDNVMLYNDSSGNIRPDKKKSGDKIDGVAASVNAAASLIRTREVFPPAQTSAPTGTDGDFFRPQTRLDL